MPTRISYDNTSIAVTKVLRGRDRKLTQEFLRLQSCSLFQKHFCLVRCPNEKGDVERLLGYARRIDQVSADSQSPVRFDSNSYCVPVKYAHRKRTVVATVSEVRLINEGQLVARHPRCWEKE